MGGDLREGQLIAGRYRTVGVLGRGGMGVVYEAEDTRLARRVAVKLLTAVEGLAEGHEALERFLREVRALARIVHPGVVTLHDAGVHDNAPYLVMQVLDGMSLAQLVAQTGPLPADVVSWVALGAARALDAAHRGGVLHRDVKPSNISLTSDGRVVIQDFGLARLAGEAAITRTGVRVGTPQFMAPETIQGALPGEAADLYGLGACMYLMMRGQLPFGDTADVGAIVERALGEGIPRLGELPLLPYDESLARLVDQLCRQDPADRPPATASFDGLLEELSAGGQEALVELMATRFREDAVRQTYARPTGTPAAEADADESAGPAGEAPEYDWEALGTVPAPRDSAAGLSPATLSDVTRRLVLSSMTPRNALSRQREAVNLVMRGQLREAAQMFAAIVPVCVSSLGPDHPTTLTSQYWQAVCLARLGAGAEAVELFSRLNRQVDRRKGRKA
ncbi:serine/threonine-protein kinase [Streptomyces sp. NPDC000410]|uniref:serine/threonine-protein kinase n=1 Tax=Streptomyces sp. NPDC000410 TaxID=3154254 RepID=UPI003326E740